MNRPRRRATAEAGLVLDILAAFLLAAGALFGEIPAGSAIVPAITLAIGIVAGGTYLYATRPRPSLEPPPPQAARCPYGSCHHNHEEGSRS
jgi:hypothetical protein